MRSAESKRLRLVLCLAVIIIVNLMLWPGFFDVAVRDFGLALGAFALAMLSRQFSRCPVTTR